MPAATGASAERMVDRVHGLAADMAAPSKPAIAAGLADGDVHVVRIGHRADGGEATAVHHALLAGIEPQDHVFAVAADDLRIGAGGTRDLAALADLDLDVVDDGADRNIGDRHSIARLDVDIFAGDVFDQRDEAGAVRIVFEPLDLGGDIELAALEVDLAVGLLVAAASIAR